MRGSLFVLVFALALAAAGCTPWTSEVARRVDPPDRAVPVVPNREPIPEEGLQLSGRWTGDAGAWIEFDPRGRVRGMDGCNRFDGTWELPSYRRMRIDARFTERQCEVAPTLVLGEEMSWRRDGSRLTLTAAATKAKSELTRAR